MSKSVLIFAKNRAKQPLNHIQVEICVRNSEIPVFVTILQTGEVIVFHAYRAYVGAVFVLFSQMLDIGFGKIF